MALHVSTTACQGIGRYISWANLTPPSVKQIAGLNSRFDVGVCYDNADFILFNRAAIRDFLRLTLFL
ncbi:MAG: hypothetical protein Ct9H300mP11_10450 [Chloroflexota bacterium]|nr:MAG: hypothetical protein Ct9H300mP11_10450 [Chloroflexota bacterium]